MDALLEYTSAAHIPHRLAQQAASPIKPLVMFFSVLRIHEILGRIRIRFRGSIPLTNGSGSGCGSSLFMQDIVCSSTVDNGKWYSIFTTARLLSMHLFVFTMFWGWFAALLSLFLLQLLVFFILYLLRMSGSFVSVFALAFISFYFVLSVTSGSLSLSFVCLLWLLVLSFIYSLCLLDLVPIVFLLFLALSLLYSLRILALSFLSCFFVMTSGWVYWRWRHFPIATD